MKALFKVTAPFAGVLAAIALCLLVSSPAKAASFTGTGPLAAARRHHTATLLFNGKVLLVGGYDDNVSDFISSAELFNPATGKSTATGSLTNARLHHTATLMPNGKVLVTGGSNDGGALSSAELYDPVSGKWSPTGTMTAARNWHTATLLADGRVLVAGGEDASFSPLASAELYNPMTGTWTATGAMTNTHFAHTASVLPNGKVLVCGGVTTDGGATASAQLYNPVAGTWTGIATLSNARLFHTATLLPNGRLLVVGGENQVNGYLASAELYDSVTGLWSGTGSLTAKRDAHTATLLPNGKVLITGGENYFPVIGWQQLSSSELYDPTNGLWTTTASLGTPRKWHTAVVLPNGSVAIAGGWVGSIPLALSSMELYDSANGTWKNTGGLNTKRYGHTATLLPNGKALVVGGYDGNVLLSSAELYNLTDGSWTNTGGLNTVHQWHTATLLPGGQVLVVAGNGSNGTNELYNPATGTWTNTAALAITRMNFTTTLLPNGKVLVAGGVAFTTNYVELASAELYDPSLGKWKATGSLNIARESQCATKLSNGKVLVAGGYTFDPTNLTDIYLSSAELYDPASGLWTETSPMTTPRRFHTMTLLPNGTVLVTGGTTNGYNHLSSAELYNPIAGTWTMTGQMSTGRVSHTAILLSNGKVLVTGGTGDGNPGYLATAELYDPATGVWSATAMLDTPRTDQTATLLPNGNVLMVGGYAPNSALSNAVLYDVGLGFSNSWQPQISTITSPLSLGNNLAITGAKFRGVSGASGGNSQDSSSDYPLVQLRSIEGGQTTFLQTTNWSTNSFTSLPVWNFPPGYALATVFVNGIPSTSSIVNISVPIPTPPRITDARKLTNGSFQFAFTNSVGAVFGALTSTNISLPLANWTALGGVTEIFPGQFQFTDSQATNGSRRFYRVRAN